MLIGLTGTPGTGKTSVSRFLERKRHWKVIHLNDLIKEEHLYTEIDKERDAVIADMELIRQRLAEIISGKENEVIILESHLAHYIADTVIVLRLYLVEAFEWCEEVFEINTTGKSIEEAGQDIEKIIEHILNGSEEELLEYRPGSIDWIDFAT